MSATRDHQHYTYGFSGVSTRDAIVFKSIVGLLVGRTHGLWRYQETGDTDMLVSGQPLGVAATAEQRSARVVLSISQLGTQGASQTLSLHWPLRANEVFAQLEHVASMLSSEQVTSVRTAVKLLCWPPTALLQQDPQFIRLAALLSARSLTAEELAGRSGVSADRCLSFVTTLVSVNCACHDEAVQEPLSQPRETAPKGLFARIRAHLGIPVASLGMFH